MISCLQTKKIKKNKKKRNTKKQRKNIMVAARACSRATIIKKKEYEKTAQKHNGRCARLLARDHNLDCGAVPYGRATAHSADAAQVDRVNVASGFRQAEWLQIVKSAKRSEIARPNFNQVFRTSMSVCPSISLSTVSTAYFWRIFEKSQLPAVGNGPRNFKSFYHEIAAWNSVISSLVISSCQAPPKCRV
jgi:hypothetical protein